MSTAPLVCQVCKKSKSPNSGMIAELIRPSLLEFIKKKIPDLDPKAFICRVKSMVAVAHTLSIFSLQDEANLTGFMRVLTESKPAWHERFGNANPVELAPTKFTAEAVHSLCRAHPFNYNIIRRDANAICCAARPIRY